MGERRSGGMGEWESFLRSARGVEIGRWTRPIRLVLAYRYGADYTNVK